MATVLTLADIQRAKSSKGDEYGAAVVDLTIQECNPAAQLEWKTIGTVEVRHRRSNSIPTVTFRQGRGAGFGGINGVTYDSVTDAVWQLAVRVEIDKIDYMDRNAPDTIEERMRLAVKGMSWTILDYFINGDHATDPYGFEGIKTRLANAPSGQTVYGVSSSAELDVRASASPSEATLYTFLDQIENAIDQGDGHTYDAAYTDADFIATLRSVLRRLNRYVDTVEESPMNIGHEQRRTSSQRAKGPVMIWPRDKGVKWYDMGYKADQTTKVVGTTTVNSVACRDVYFAKLGGPDYLHGIQQYAMDVDGPKKSEDGATYYVNIDWPLGLHHVHNKTFGALKGVRVA